MVNRAWLAVALLVSFCLARPAVAADQPAGQAPATNNPATAQEDKAKDRDEEYYELFKVLVDTIDQVDRNYVKDVKRRDLVEAAIRGVLEKLDPYSNYISPDEISRFKTSVENQFGGIGIQVDIRRGQLLVVSPIVGSPAYRAGLQPGDFIVEIEGKSTDGINIDEAVRRLKGEAGTSVTITILRPQTHKRQTVTIRREMIHLETVKGDRRDDRDRWDFMLDKQKRIGYVRVTAFGRDTERELRSALDQLQRQNLRGLILDLRFNPGGLLSSAIGVADLFLSEGEIVSTAGRNSPKRSWSAHKPDTFEGFPMAVLVNRASASASEIVAAALQDHKCAVIIGERTWGKGSVQNVIDLEGGKSALKLTTASYRRPNGRNIHRFPDSKETDEWGVMPDPGFEIKLPDDELVQLNRVQLDRDLLEANHSAPLETSTADNPSAEGKPADEKPAADKPAEPQEESSSDSPASPDAGKPAAASPPAAEAAKSPFVDRQLQKAIDYLSGELAKAK